MPKIGVQAMMLKDDFAEAGPFETLRRVSEIGYHAVEVSQIPMTPDNVAELGRARDELGMDIASLSAALDSSSSANNDSLADDFDKIVADAQTLGASMVRIGMLPIPAMASLDRVLEFSDRTNAYAERFAEHGIDLYYHNHHIEFTKFDGRYMLDIIAERAPRVGLEIDVHWVARGGLDPARTLEKYRGRVAMVHLKDYRVALLPDRAFAALDAGDHDAFTEAFTSNIQFGEVGEGNLDFPGIITTAGEVGAKYLLVEQDQRYGRTALECLQTSYDNLVAMGFAELF
ncbi:sugar phosphate isomerase/epimerase family protein [Frigoribacterium sp. 2-23]|uniref:sugar phosphate isomerase/epimerase family protein n=1 Tax=Frigoribacterium sp. 2-23 TaxID=3415006 RepID=UPI003C705C13